MPDFLSFINEILWGSVMIYLLLGAGIWFSWQTRGIQFRYVRKFGRSLKKKPAPAAGWFNVLSGALYQPCSPGRQRQSCRGDAGDRHRWARRRILDVGFRPARHGQQLC